MTQTVEDTRPRTESIIRRGALAGFALAGIKLLVLALAIWRGAEGHLAPLADLSNLVDVAIFAGLSLGVWKRSRTAAVLLPLYFVPSELFVFRQTGEAGPQVRTVAGLADGLGPRDFVVLFPEGTWWMARHAGVPVAPA